MFEVASGDQEDIDIWMRAMDGDTTEEEWREFFRRKRFVTGCDFPLTLFYKELMVAFPEAKVVLSTRDPKTWHHSVFNSIWRFDQLMEGWSYAALVRMLDGRKNAGRPFFWKIRSKVPQGCSLNFHEAIERGPLAAEQFFLDWQKEVVGATIK